jgi:lipopolysaccharide export system permease protein
MRILDRYVAKNFIVGYLIAFGVLMGLCIVIDMFVNVDEWIEDTGVGAAAVLHGMAVYYGSRVALWFRDMAGMITIIAAVFSLTRMTRSNELIAVMASGVSLKRIIAPILFLALLLTGVQIADQEAFIPRMAAQLTRSHDEMTGDRSYALWFVTDSRGNLISAARYEEQTRRMVRPIIVPRQEDPTGHRRVTGRLTADAAVYDPQRGGWVLENGSWLEIEAGSGAGDEAADVSFVPSDLTPAEIPLRIQEGYKTLLSSRQIEALIQSPGTRPTDMAELYLQKHIRITDPLINLIMLMVALPVLVCRDPRNMKSAIMTSFVVTSACFLITFLCKLFATEPFFHQVRPELWAWLPVFIFFPIAFLQIDGMKT